MNPNASDGLVIKKSRSVHASVITGAPLILLLGMFCPGTAAADLLFGAKTDFATGTFPSSVGIRDLNGDGKPDLRPATLLVNDVSGREVMRHTLASVLGKDSARQLHARSIGPPSSLNRRSVRGEVR